MRGYPWSEVAGLVGGVLLVAALAAAGIWLDHIQAANCQRHGGNWQQVGVTITTSKKSTTVTPVMGCVGEKH